MNDGAVCNDANVRALADDPRATERDRVVRTGIRGPIVRLAIQMFVFEEQDGIIAPDRRAKQAAKIERVRRHYDAYPWRMREQHFTRLAVIGAASRQVAAEVGTRMTAGALNAPFDRQRTTESSFRSCIIAGQM